MSLRSEVIRIVNEILGRSKKISEMDAAGSLDGTELIEVVKSGVNVRTTVSAVGSGGGVSSQFMGAFNGNGTDVHPSEGTGSGTAGAIQAGDQWYESSGTAINTAYGGTVPIRTIYQALTTTPGTDATKWRLI